MHGRDLGGPVDGRVDVGFHVEGADVEPHHAVDVVPAQVLMHHGGGTAKKRSTDE
jgi:hypothetical protein